jgi:hypothetical protein
MSIENLIVGILNKSIRPDYEFNTDTQTLTKLNQENKMTDLKKYLDVFNWIENTKEELISQYQPLKYEPDYVSTYQQIFGMCPVLFLQIEEKVLPQNKFLKFQKFLMDNGFKLVECGLSTFKYVNYDNIVVISGDAYLDELDEDEDEDEDDIRPVYRDSVNIYIHILPTIENRKFIEKLIKGIVSKFLSDVSKQEDKFYLIAQNAKGLFTQKTKFKAIPIKDERYDLFYGDKFPHEKLQKFITDETENLMLLHGDPGTGKSNYIKHIITNSKKKVIYIPPSMLSVISSPSFVTFMIENHNTILLIEDAEEVLSVDRNAATNNLLGLTDGFLKDALNLKIIATFNCDVGKIDPALMRKGRLYFEYKFDKLGIDDCKNLAEFMGLDRVITEPMTLADFFVVEDNHMENSFEERRIGFL